MKQRILMCPPDYFGVAYVINPWMEGHIGDADAAVARQEWNGLRDALAQHADLVFQPPQPGLPDLVFTANAGIVRGDKAIVSRFRNRERQGEEPHDLRWFRDNGFDVLDWPQEVSFEGAGDALFDRGQDILWVAHGTRSHESAPGLLEQKLGRRTVVVNLIDPRFYHLDTCLCPLEGGYLMYFPGAFDAESVLKIENLVPESLRIAVDELDAVKFCCNAVDIDRHVFMNGASDELQARLRRAGFAPQLIPVGEFMKAGGGVKCLTLKLVEK